MTTSTTPRWLPTALCLGALAVLSLEDAQNLRDWIGGQKEAYEESVRAGRLTMEEACARFREDIVALAHRLADHAAS